MVDGPAKLEIQICASRKSLGIAAVQKAANLIQLVIAEHGQVRVMILPQGIHSSIWSTR
jgi:hypothetical protein